MSEFITPFKSKYTEPISPSKNKKFTSEYTVKPSNKCISGEDRPQSLKFKSRLVTK